MTNIDRPNKADVPNTAITSLLQRERHPFRVGDLLGVRLFTRI